jgi:hypothetical protein
MAGDEPLLYFEPSNDIVRDPSAEQVIALMRRDGEYWGPYSPVGRLLCQKPARVSLYFVRHPRRGWYLQYESEAPARNLVAYDPNAERGRWVEHWAEGETAYFPVACFLPQSTAERVVADFIALREPSAAAAWEPFDWRVHRLQGPPEDESLVVEESDFPG